MWFIIDKYITITPSQC